MCFFFTSFFPLCARAHVYFFSVDINTMPKHNHSLWQTQRIINIKITCFPPGEQSVPVTFHTHSLCLFLSRSIWCRSLSLAHSLFLCCAYLRAVDPNKTHSDTNIMCIHAYENRTPHSKNENNSHSHA